MTYAVEGGAGAVICVEEGSEGMDDVTEPGLTACGPVEEDWRDVEVVKSTKRTAAKLFSDVGGGSGGDMPQRPLTLLRTCR